MIKYNNKCNIISKKLQKIIKMIIQMNNFKKIKFQSKRRFNKFKLLQLKKKKVFFIKKFKKLLICIKKCQKMLQVKKKKILLKLQLKL